MVDTQIISEYDDKDGSKAKAILDKAEKSKAGHRDDESDDDDDGGGPNKGPSVCSVDQSAITGESLAVDKHIGDVAYFTCGVKRGKCFGMVVCSAKQSFVGKTASLVSSGCLMCQGGPRSYQTRMSRGISRSSSGVSDSGESCSAPCARL